MLSDGARLARIRAQLDAIAPGLWLRSFDERGCFVEARGAMGELVPLARFEALASEDEIGFVTAAPGDMRFLLALVDRAIAFARGRDAPSASAPTGAGGVKDYAAECAMKCAEPAFRVFLEERHGLERPLTDERVAQKVRSLLGVTSRAELNQPVRAADAWAGLRADFEVWRRAGR